MEIMRERRQRRYQRKRQPLVLRKISEINEDAETDDEPIFDDIENGFTMMRRLTEGDEDLSEQSSENDENEQQDTKTESIDQKQKESKKRGVFNMFRWMRKYSLRIKP
uniref:Uncharacterized protein n=1 Tax=Heterorhabditis bacteriophora TaxID=37862 RepID=A0A1I7WL98_HETBA